MRKYSAPSAEKITFDYKNQVVASNGGGTVSSCDYINTFTISDADCTAKKISFQLDNGN